MTILACSVDGCDNPHLARGYCNGHYQRVKKTGTPGPSTLLAKYLDPADSFAARTKWQDGHLIWIAAKNNKGYPQMTINGRRVLVHRYSYARTHGPIPEGMWIDHICHVPLCVNPAHLRAVTPKQNVENVSDTPRGAYWRKDLNKWCASIMHDYQVIQLGLFDSLEDATEAARQARLEHFTHNDHDRAA